MLRNRKGFTFVELMIVVVIIGLIVAVGFPAVRAAKQTRILEEAMFNCQTAQEVVGTFYREHGRLPDAGELETVLTAYCAVQNIKLKNPDHPSFGARLLVIRATYDGAPLILRIGSRPDEANLTAKERTAGDICYYANEGGYRFWVYDRKGKVQYSLTKLVPPAPGKETAPANS